MDGKKVYQIQINGITESVNAVEALNKQLDALDARIKTLQSKSVNVGTGGGTKSSSNASSLSEEAKLEKQIAQIDEKRKAYSKEIYQNYLAAQDVLKETVNDQKQIAAQERLQAKTYGNTMAGLKQELADIKTVMQTTDLGDNKFQEMTKRAGELTNKLKELEQSYGQFGRNVGNYSSAFDGMQKLKITVGGIEREFNSAREASKTLKNELIGLEAAGSGNTEVAKELRAEYYKLKSAMDDATKSSKAMDNAMDTMQSFTAMASVGNGLQAFFGFDDNEINKSIQKLVALQGVLTGIETIRKQMETGEGIGGVLTKGFDKIDTYTYSLKRMNVAINGTGTAAKIAAVGIKTLGYALKGLLSAGLLVGIDLLVEGIQKLVGWVKEWAKGDAELIKSIDVVNNTIEAQNIVLQKNLELIQKKLSAGQITAEQARIQTEKAYAEALQETNKALLAQEELLRKNNVLGKGGINLESLMGDKGVTWIGGFRDAIKSISDFNKRFDELTDAVANEKSMKSWFSTVSDAKDELSHLTKMIANDYLNAMHKFADGTAEGTKKLIEYVEHMDELTNGRYSKAMKLVKVDNEGLQKELDESWDKIETLRDKVFKNPVIVSIELDAKIEQELDRLDPTRVTQRKIDEYKAMLQKGVDEAGNILTEGQKKNINKIITENTKQMNEARQKRANTIKSNAKKLATEIEAAEKELNSLRIENMDEGLNKEIKQLEEEKRQRIAKVRANGRKVHEIELEIEKLYANKEKKLRKEHAKEVEKIYAEMWANISQIQMSTLRMNLDSQLTEMDTQLERGIEKLQEKLNSRYASYQTQYPSNMPKSLGDRLGIWDMGSDEKGMGDMVKMAKEYLDLVEKIEVAKARGFAWGGNLIDTSIEQDELDEAKKALEEWLKANETTQKEMEDMLLVQEFKNRSYTASLSNAYRIRISDIKKYYYQVEQLQKEHSEKTLENDKQLLDAEFNYETSAENARYKAEVERLEENQKKLLEEGKDYNALRQAALDAHTKALKALQEKHRVEEEKLEQDHQNRLKNITQDSLNGRIQEYRDFYSAISNLQSRQPEKLRGVLGDFGFINVTKTRKNYKEVLDAFTDLMESLQNEKDDLQKQFDNHEITFDDFQQAKRELNDLEQACADSATQVTNNLKNLTGQQIQQINQYIQAVGQTLQGIMSAMWEYQDYLFEKQQKDLDDWNKKLEEALDKQKDIVEEHKNAIDDIESELATARGDRRQHLIDQLNAEIAAQRAAQKEEQKIKKQQEANEKKQEQLDKKRKEAEYNRNLLSIIVSTAMATANGLATQPFWPVGVAMGALATTLGMVQYALAAKSKPYAHGGQLDGGVAQGPRHSQGGIKVLGGRAEIEGGEFITNRKSTASNIDLLEYINSKKTRVDLSDLLEFYNGNTIKKTIRSVRTRFEDGGYVPTLPNELDIKDQLQNIVVNQDNRPVVVSVVDINNKQEDVRRVQTLAGL